MERQDLPLWERVLRDDNPHRRELIDQVRPSSPLRQCPLNTTLCVLYKLTHSHGAWQ